MPVEIPCPGCRFLFRADDEFAGESAPCPHCGATILVPRSERITPTRRHLNSAPDRRVRHDPRSANSLPIRERPPIPQHAEPRPIILPEPDEDHLGNEGGYWPFGAMVPPGRKMRTLYDVCRSTERVASLLAEPLKRLRPLYGLLFSTLWSVTGCWVWAYKLCDDYPYLSLLLGLAGCYVVYASARILGEGIEENSSEAHSFESESPTRRRQDEMD